MEEHATKVCISLVETRHLFNTIVGGRFFPGEHYSARFDVQESGARYSVSLCSDDGRTNLHIVAHSTKDLPATSVFGSVEEASSFFERGSVGYSKTNVPGCFDGLELKCLEWHVEPLEVEQVTSSFFGDVKTICAPDAASTWSSCFPLGKSSISSKKSLFHGALTTKTLPASAALESGRARSALLPVARCPLTVKPGSTFV